MRAAVSRIGSVFVLIGFLLVVLSFTTRKIIGKKRAKRAGRPAFDPI
jgi:hypothetical protein